MLSAEKRMDDGGRAPTDLPDGVASRRRVGAVIFLYHKLQKMVASEWVNVSSGAGTPE